MAYKNRIYFFYSFHRLSPTLKSLGRISIGTYFLPRPRQEPISLCGARGLRVIRSCLLVCCSHSRLLSSSNSASQIPSRLVTFASASYGFPSSMTKQSNSDDVPFSKPRTCSPDLAVSEGFERHESRYAKPQLDHFVFHVWSRREPPSWASRGDDRPYVGYARTLMATCRSGLDTAWRRLVLFPAGILSLLSVVGLKKTCDQKLSSLCCSRSPHLFQFRYADTEHYCLFTLTCFTTWDRKLSSWFVPFPDLQERGLLIARRAP